ncbi:hypothetical protein DH2020_038904 [Rehmannia glutinosa]|uniref:Major facilitator superfamily (MFS) profile domain-containing protein n=1 Tax=Rehmannia glutinosa TaxID=99300 RepID=A0ABR0UZX7_REHGL
MGFANNYAVLMVGRFVAGLGVGYALMIAPVYAAEVAPTSSRVLLGYLSNYAFAKFSLKLGWRLMLGVGAVPSVFLGLAVFIMPESPRWLVMQGRLGDAKKVLDKTSDSLEEAQLRLADIKEAAGLPEDCHDDVVEVPKTDRGGGGVWGDLLIHPTRPVLHIVIAALGLQFLQQASGIDAVVMYSPRIYEEAGITSDSKKLLATIAVGVCKTVFILVTTFFVDRIGRRVLCYSRVRRLRSCRSSRCHRVTVIDR